MEVQELSGTDRVVRVRFKGVVYRRYPLAKQSSDRNYFRPGPGDVIRGRSYLHRDLWSAIHGPIPDGYEVDHADGDPLNNAPDNLQLLLLADHKAKHAAELGERSRRRMAAMSTDERREFLAAAAAWHSTEAGRKWHSQQSKAIAANMPTVRKVCERCGGEYEIKVNAEHRARFCSDRCKAAARRSDGVDDVDRTCERCGAVFRINQYAPAKHCSRKCARGPAATRPCKRCGTVFACPPSVGRQYCGHSCAYADRRGKPRTGLQPHG